jgi:hypothetical protein
MEWHRLLDDGTAQHVDGIGNKSAAGGIRFAVLVSPVPPQKQSRIEETLRFLVQSGDASVL